MTETRDARSRTDIDEASSATLTDRSASAVQSSREEDRVRMDESSAGSESLETDIRPEKTARGAWKKVKTGLILAGVLLAGVLALVWACKSKGIRKTIKTLLNII